MLATRLLSCCVAATVLLSGLTHTDPGVKMFCFDDVMEKNSAISSFSNSTPSDDEDNPKSKSSQQQLTRE